jgi:hypothetical protein
MGPLVQKFLNGWVWWHVLVIPALRRQRQEDAKFEASPGYMVRPCLKIIKNFKIAEHHWILPVILATQEAAIRKITVQAQLRQMNAKQLS